jgi:hypothetical protein
MPVRVVIPVRLRVDAAALHGRADAVADAVAAAVGRAVARSREVVLGPRGGYLAPAPRRPTFTWLGAGLPDLTAADRAEWEARLGERIDAAFRAAVPPPPAAPAPLAGRPAERFDPARAAGPGAYRVPVYDDRGREAAAPLAGGPDPGATPGEEPFDPAAGFGYAETLRAAVRMPVFRSLDELAAAVRTRIGRNIIRRTGVGYLAVFLQYAERGESGYTVVLYDQRDGLPKFQVPIDPAGLTRLRPSVVAEHGVEVDPLALPPAARMRLKVLGRPESAAARAGLYYREFGPQLRGFVRPRARQNLIDRGTPAPDDRAIDREADRLARAAAAAQVARVRFPTLVVLHIGQLRIVLDCRDELPDGLDIEVTPILAAAPYRGTAGPGPDGAPPCPGRDPRSGRDPLSCEPPVPSLAPASDTVRLLMDELAARLGLPAGVYAGAFCVEAARAVVARTEVAATRWEFTAGRYGAERGTAAYPTADDTGREFHLAPSGLLDELRRLAAHIPKITRLRNAVVGLIHAPGVAARIGGHRHNDATGWELDLVRELNPTLRAASALIFAAACRAVYAQMLFASRAHIVARLRPDRLEPFARLFAELVVKPGANRRTAVEELAALEQLLATLRGSDEYKAAHGGGGVVADAAGGVLGGWRAAHRLFADALDTALLRRPEVPAGPVPAGGLASLPSGEVGVSNGTRLYSEQDLRVAIAVTRGALEAVDPLIRQFANTDEVMSAIGRDEARVGPVLKEKLETMRAANGRQMAAARDDVHHAFGIRGTHALAQQAVGPAFDGDPHLDLGYEFLASSEEGKRSLFAALEMFGLVILSVVCPPAGVYVGAAAALYHWDEARTRREELTAATLDPDLVADRAELEAEQFASELALVLAFLPAAGPVVRAGRSAVRAGARAAARGVAAQAARQFALSREMITRMGELLVLKMGEEFVKGEVINHLIEALLTGPVRRQILDEFRPPEGGAGR